MQGYTRLDTYRFERKFVAEKVSRPAVELVIKQNSAFFSESFPSRKVNNIYFDTPGMDCYFSNLFGVGNRWKVRVRWYDDMFGKIESPVLEFKIKKGFAGTKKSYELPAFEIDPANFFGNSCRNFFVQANLPDEVLAKLSGLQPVLLNAYERSYLESRNKRFRITLDNGMEYYNLRPTWNHFLNVHKEYLKTVIELKYDHLWEEEAEHITNQFPFRLDKNSKYIAGISHFKSEIAQ